MKAKNHLRVVTHTFLKPFRNRAAGTLALGLALLLGASTGQAGTFTWTNTTGAAFNDPTAWSPVGGPGGAADTANFIIAGNITTFLTNNFQDIGLLIFGGPAAGQNLTVSLNFDTNNFAGLSGNSSSASGFVFGQQAGSTNTVFISVGTMYCTNAANTPSNARLIVGRNGPAIVFVTNGTVVAGNLVMANGAGASGSQLILSGSGTFWTNQTSVSIANNAAAFNNRLVISNSASMTALSTFNVGSVSGSGGNSLLLDTSARLFTRNQDPSVGAPGSSNNTATIQGGAFWDVGGRRLLVGNGGGTAVSNTLRIGTSSVVSNITLAIITAGNTLDLQGGILRVSTVVTNAGVSSGFGTVVGNAVVPGTLTPGNGSTVGSLTYSNNLTLASSSTTIMKLDRGQAGSNDLVTVVSTATEAGTLTINNVGAALVGGDTFKIFALGTKAGDFTSTNLPSLNSPLVWNTSQLGSSGIISVVLPAKITGPDPQAVLTNTDVTISTVVTGVPTPVVQWQKGGVNVSDGATGNGSTISGSTSTTLTILNSQVPDSGQYCLIASNFAGAVTNCMTLVVTTNTAAPLIGGPVDQNVISPNSATFTAVVAGIPTPTQQWRDNGVNISDATNTTLIIPGVTFALDGHVYSIIASNSDGTATNSAALHVVVPPLVAVQPVSLVVTQTQSATFSVLSTNGVPAPTYQWSFNNVPITGATNTSYTIASAAVANAGTYKVVLVNIAGSATSSNATLTVNSTMTASVSPTNGAANVCYDTPLVMVFDRTPVNTLTGKIKIFNVTNSVTPVDTIDTSIGNLQSRVIGTENFNTFPVIITNLTAAIYPHLGVLSSNQTYYVTVDPGTFSETNGALFAGITNTTAWVITTKPTGPANPNNVVVAADGSGDFCTVQGAVDSLPNGNTTYTLVNIRNGTYTEVVDTRTKNHITFRGQSRTGTVVGYRNNDSQNGGTHARMAFKIFSNDMAIENMTVVNTTPQGGSQAEALMIDSGAGHFILYNAEVDSRQDTILANVNTSQGYFFKSLIQGNFDYIWGGGNCFFTNCEIRTIAGANNFNLTAARTDTGATGNWPGFGGLLVSNGLSFVNCRLTRASSSVTNITLAGANGTQNGLAAFINCSIDVSNNNGYITPPSGVLSNELVWEFGNSNLDNTAAVTYGITAPPLTNGDARLLCASSATCWLNGWVPQLAPNILTNPVSQTVTAGVGVSFSVVATGIPDPTYQWLKGGNNILNATNTTFAILSVVTDDAGTYSVIVSNTAGSVTSSNATLTVLGTAPVASFTATPNSGTEPLGVTFTDTSSGSSNIYLAWDFGDANTSNTLGGATILHTYAAGTYTVTLTASNTFGSNTLVSNNCITVVTAFQAWQQLHFGCTLCSQAAASADPDGDGQNNQAEFLAGTDPNNAGSALQILTLVPVGQDVSVTWTTAGGRTNIVQATSGDVNGNYTANFTDLTAPIAITGSGDVTNNYVDVGGATNSPGRYYRVRLAP